MKWILVIVVGLAVAGGGVLWGKGLLKPSVVHLLHRPPKPVLVTLPSITSNIATQSGENFAEVTITVKLADKADAKLFAQDTDEVQSAVITELRGETMADLQGSAAVATLGKAVGQIVDRVLNQPDAVQGVYFTKFLVQ